MMTPLETLDEIVRIAERARRSDHPREMMPAHLAAIWTHAAIQASALRRQQAKAGAAQVDQHADLKRAAAALEQALNEIGDLNSRLRRLARLETDWAEFQAIVADCQQWFNGFAAAHAGRESWERPRIPDPGRLRELNLALQAVDPNPEEDLPF